MNHIQTLARTNRPAFIEARRDHQKRLRALPVKMTRMEYAPSDHMANLPNKPVDVWQSRDFLALVYWDSMTDGTIQTRISINRAEIENDGNWKQGISWDELMRIKSEIGFADKWAVECFPPDSNVVNVANMRHLFIVPQPLFGWVPKSNTTPE